MMNKFVYAMAILFTSNLVLAADFIPTGYCTLEEYDSDLHGKMLGPIELACGQWYDIQNWTTPNDLRSVRCFCATFKTPSGGNTNIQCHFVDRTGPIEGNVSNSSLSLGPDDRKNQIHQTSKTYRNGSWITMKGWCSDPQY